MTTWTLSNGHVTDLYITPRSQVDAFEAREQMQADYRRFVMRACLTHDLAERATLQASARRLYATLHGSGFDGAVLSLLAEGDQTYTYSGESDAAPLHCTLVFLGPAAGMTNIQQDRVVGMARRIGQTFDPFDADVVSPAEFDRTPVRLVEHQTIQDAHDMALADRTISWLNNEHDDHPHYLPHVSGLGDRDTVRFDRVAAMIGGRNHVFPLGAEPGMTQTADY
jgi:hypothetical protein